MNSIFSPTTIVADQRIRVAGLNVNVATLAEAVDVAIARAIKRNGFTFYTLNLDHIVKLRWSAAFRAAYRRATFVCADGWPIVRLANRAAQPGARAIQRTTGADFVEPLLSAAALRGLPIYLVGPTPGVQADALAALRQRLPDLRVVGVEAPEIAGDDPLFDRLGLARRIRASGARLCLIALGAPKQELIADALAAQCPSVGFVCVGAALDFIAKRTRRAPAWMRNCGLEWLWRLGSEPLRLAPRYLLCAYVLLLLELGFAVVPSGERA
jgi:N-acetylglucosaminyldiphosphoundecaprenol N-acetyl-beta-D-mannosaminyltransferase